MRQDRDALAGLERIARLKADMEMRRLAAFRAHVEATRHRIGQLETELQGTSIFDRLRCSLAGSTA